MSDTRLEHIRTIPSQVIEVPLIQMWRLDIGNRRINDLHLTKLMHVFDLDKVGVFTLSDRGDGSYAILDGQHRHEAMMRLDLIDWEQQSEVYAGLTTVQEIDFAQSFNTMRKGWTATDKFASALVRQDPEALAIRTVVENHGFKINTTESHRDNGGITAVGSLLSVFQKFRGDTLDQVLRAIAHGWGIERGPSGAQIQGVAMFVGRYRNMYVATDLDATLSRINPDQLEARGKTVQQALGISKHDGIGRLILNTYNLRKSTHRLPEWDVAKNLQTTGESHAHAVLSEEMVREIRAVRALGPTEIGKRLGVKRETVTGVLSNRTWRHVT